jgi:hypothetical protein
LLKPFSYGDEKYGLQMVEVSLTLLPPPVAFLRSVLELFEQFLHFTMILAQHPCVRHRLPCVKFCKEHTSHDEERGYFTKMRLSNGVERSKEKISIQGIPLSSHWQLQMFSAS